MVRRGMRAEAMDAVGGCNLGLWSRGIVVEALWRKGDAVAETELDARLLLSVKGPQSMAGYDPSWSVKIVFRDENRLRPERGVFRKHTVYDACRSISFIQVGISSNNSLALKLLVVK